MKRAIAFLVFVHFTVVQTGQIVADHTVVDQYDKIPQQYIDEVKKMLIDLPGISHSLGYQHGLNLLERYDNRFQVTTYNNTSPPSYSNQYLRFGKHGNVAEDGFYTSRDGIDTFIEYIDTQNGSGNPFSVIGLGWCYTMTWHNNPGGTIDPVYQVRWAGSSVGGPQGDLRWGLNSGDQALTGNSVNMDTYLAAIEYYNTYYSDKANKTLFIVTTGPVDMNEGTENGFQREIKHDYIRQYVNANLDALFFDYADILVHNNAGQKNIVYWNDGGNNRPHAQIHPDNLMDYNDSWGIIAYDPGGDPFGDDHIGEVGALRLAKAIWWLLARIAGWDGGTSVNIPVSSITVTGQGGATSITTDNGTLQMIATVLPSNATNKTVTWSITNGSSYATINSTTGLLTAVANGTVTVRATATDGSNVYGSTTITISGQIIPVTSITVSGQGGATSITTDNGTLQMIATVLPSNATNKTVTWSITSGGSYATINSATGLLTAVDNGTVTVRATATDGSNVYGSTTITISGQIIPVTSITVSGQGGATSITTDNGTLQMIATVLPSNATNKTGTWSITSGGSYATINSTTGLLTAVDNGTVTVRATATDGSNVYGSTTITISGQVIPVTSINVTGQGGATSITTNGGTLQMVATALPSNATNKTVTWSITSGNSYATINSATGLLTAVANGTVTVRATATDGSNVYGSTTITISNQTTPVVLVTSITISGQGGATSITTDGGTLQMVATVLPSNATNKTVTWSITSGGSYATINSATGLLTAVDNGTVTVRATATDGSNVYGSTTITISNQTTPVVLVTNITVTGQGGATSITTNGGTLQMVATALPSNATNKTVTWSITSGSSYATINSATGLLTAVANGTVTVRATATDGSNVYGSTTITISGQIIRVTGITVTGQGGATSITTNGGTLQMVATVLPSNATNKTVTWSITSGSPYATINSATGLLTAVANGTVTVRATATDGSNVYGSTTISISNQTTPVVLVTSITVSGQGGATSITTDNGTLQMVATVLPSNATNKTVTWSITSGNSYATINSATGLLTAVANGTVTVRATATDGSNVYGSTTITISGQIIPVTGITVTGQGGATSITTDGGTLQMVATLLPSNATNKTVTWSITNGSSYATINSTTGLLTAVANGTVTVRATATDGSNVYGSTTITISGQVIPVTSITVTGQGGATSITTDGGTLQMVATLLPSNATNKTVTWSITNGSSYATINSTTGLLTAVANGTVTVRATATDGSNVYGSTTITISGQVIPVTSITVTGQGGATSITTNGGTLQMVATVLPSNATNKTVTWSIINSTGQATINSSGLVTAVSNGIVTARATANDGSGVYGQLVITINSQLTPVTAITINAAGGSTSITAENGTLQLTATISPDNATDKNISWSISNGTGEASISSTGLVTAVSKGNVIVEAATNDGSGVFSTIEILIDYIEIPDFRIIVDRNKIEILFDEDQTGLQVGLYNLAGYLIQNKPVIGNSCEFNISHLPTGLYIILISKSMIYRVEKIIIPG